MQKTFNKAQIIWEYQIEWSMEKFSVDDLCERGLNGWELVLMNRGIKSKMPWNFDISYEYIFKRQKYD